MSNVDKFLKLKNWAVVGVTPDPFKFGYKIWKKLKNEGYNVFAINPFYDEVNGEKIYSNLKDVEEKIDVIDMVVPPKVTIDYLEQAKELGIENIWFQPDTFNDETIEKAESLDMEYIDDDCVLKVLTERKK